MGPLIGRHMSMGPLIGCHMSVSPLIGCHMSGCHLMMLTPAPGGQWRWTVSCTHPNIVCLVTSSAVTVVIRVIMSDIMSDITVTEAILAMSLCVTVSAQHGSATKNNCDS